MKISFFFYSISNVCCPLLSFSFIINNFFFSIRCPRKKNVIKIRSSEKKKLL